ncbi:MAG TPA: AraC family transcriptional regulator [Opitutaceae bacterium]|nr:AraC family transcriptional regulator [Opitutaceae bacterium]
MNKDFDQIQEQDEIITPANDVFACVRVAADEMHTPDEKYFWDNQQRPEHVWDVLAIQRTVAGTGFFQDANGPRTVRQGQAMLFSHHEASSYGYPADATEPYRLRFMQVWPTPAFRPVFEQLRRDFGPVVSMPDNSIAVALFNEVFTRYSQRTFHDRLHESELLHRMLIAIYREQVQETHSSDPIEFGYHYVRNHFRSPVNIKVVAAKCGISREHFIRQFGERFGEAPGTMLRRLRLEHADAMLSATKMTVEDVAQASGFFNPDSFSRAYRMKFGHSPRGRATTKAIFPTNHTKHTK